MILRYIFSFTITLGFLFFTGCKKVVEQKKQDALVDAMVASTWYVAQYLEGTTVYTTDYEAYDFNFKSDYTVIAKKGAESFTGTWGADINTKILTAKFTSGNPLNRLNGNWSIYYQDSQGPKMNQTVSGTELKLTLRIR